MRVFSHLNSAKLILGTYKGDQPFGHFIRDFFRTEKKYGSRDRKRIAHLCYSYFRLGNAFNTLSLEDRILIGLFLTSGTADELLTELRPQWIPCLHLPIEAKISITGLAFEPGDIFPLLEQVQDEINREQFSLSHLQQPDLFIRIRPGFENIVRARLKEHAIAFEELANSRIVLPNATKLETVFTLNKEIIIQDNSSQLVGELMQDILIRNGEKPALKVWDCCAASGGKSIMAYDINRNISLTVSDIRPAILANLKNRFSEAGINKYSDLVADLSKEAAGKLFNNDKFDLIIADVPCTGSGTWGRTPEYLSYFNTGQLAIYVDRQKKICSNIAPALKESGYLLYITCSVYRDENDAVVDDIRRDTGLKLVKKVVVEGYYNKADTMFAALLQKTS